MVDKISELRKAANVCTVTHDERLGASAQRHVNDLVSRKARPHDGFPQRLKDAGFPEQNCGARSGFPNCSEGVSWGQGEFSPEELVSILNDNGAHGRDFRDPVFNLVGVAYAHNDQSGESYVVVEYGCLCKGDPAKLSEEDFGMFHKQLTECFHSRHPEYSK